MISVPQSAYLAVREADRDTETHLSGEFFFELGSLALSAEESRTKAKSIDNLVCTSDFKPPKVVAVVPVTIIRGHLNV